MHRIQLSKQWGRGGGVPAEVPGFIQLVLNANLLAKVLEESIAQTQEQGGIESSACSLSSTPSSSRLQKGRNFTLCGKGHSLML